MAEWKKIVSLYSMRNERYPRTFTDEQFPRRPRPAPRPSEPGCWANVLVHKDALQYAEMTAKAFERDADIREYRYCPLGIWVTRIWLGHDVIR